MQPDDSLRRQSVALDMAFGGFWIVLGVLIVALIGSVALGVLGALYVGLGGYVLGQAVQERRDA